MGAFSRKLSLVQSESETISISNDKIQDLEFGS